MVGKYDITFVPDKFLHPSVTFAFQALTSGVCYRPETRLKSFTTNDMAYLAFSTTNKFKNRL
jgi:hypothetical protein